jgi:beta-glucosidase
MSRAFPSGFDWGTATAAHQIEGGNWNNDWWAWEHDPSSSCPEPSGDACDSWNRWPDDVALVRDLGLGSYRFSIEWSRIEPEPGEWSHASIDHYRRLGDALRDAGIRPVVTLNHFTLPRWFTAAGGWTGADALARFATFCERAARELAPVLGQVCTINEPNIVAVMGHLMGVWPPGRSDLGETQRVVEVLARAHRVAVDAVRSGAPGVPVGLTLSMTDYQAVDGGEEMVAGTRALMEDPFLAATEGDDFIGVQTYSRMLVGPKGPVGNAPDSIVLPMGYEYWPESLAATIRRAWESTSGTVPLYVTENGIGTDDDTLRVSYVETALAGVLDCIDDGIDVRGYTYWSLMDNFEWAFGYEPRFGLTAVDRDTFARTLKPSARRYAAIVAANAL